MADPQIQRFELAQTNGDEPPIFIWGRPEKLDLFFKDTALIEVDAVDPAIVPQSVKAYSRRQYPGDPTTVPRRSGTRRRAIAGDFKRVALPGRPFWCEDVITAPGVTPKRIVKYQFTLQGSFTALRVLAPSWAVAGFTLRSPSGRAWDIAVVPASS